MDYTLNTTFTRVNYADISNVELTKMVREYIPTYNGRPLGLTESLAIAKIIKAVAVENHRLGVIKGRIIKKPLVG